MNKATGMTRIIKATGYSLQGLKQAWRHEAAFRQEVIAYACCGYYCLLAAGFHG